MAGQECGKDQAELRYGGTIAFPSERKTKLVRNRSIPFRPVPFRPRLNMALVSNGCSISRCCGREVLFLIGREILPTKYLRKQKVSRFADKSTKFKKLPTASEARGVRHPHTPRSDAPGQCTRKPQNSS